MIDFLKKILGFIFGINCMLVSLAYGQDPNFTQFYNAPLQLNPAFTGLVEQFRVASSYRRQWSQIPGAVQTNIFSVDYNLSKANSGIGVVFMNDRMGVGNYQSNHILLSYAYRFNLSEKWQVVAGMQGGYQVRSAAYSSLRFGDQIETGTGGTSLENLDNFNAGLPDLSAGALIYNQTFWFGFSVFHLNYPQTVTEVGIFELPERITINGGARLPLGQNSKGRMALTPAFLFQRQGQFDQLDLGINYLYAPLMLGVWYRGLPLKSDVEGNPSSDAIALLTGFQIKDFFFGYSYDFNVSGLAGRSGGSHEISIVWEPSNLLNRKEIQCPAFYHRMQKRR